MRSKSVMADDIINPLTVLSCFSVYLCIVGALAREGGHIVEVLDGRTF